MFVLLAAAIGIGVLARSERRPHVLALAAAPGLMFLYLGSRRANYIRNLLPLLPFLAIACAPGSHRCSGMAPALSRKPSNATPKSVRLVSGSSAGRFCKANPALVEWSNAKAPNRASVLARVHAR